MLIWAAYVINHSDLNDNKLWERKRIPQYKYIICVCVYVCVMAVMIEGGGAGPSGLERLNIHHMYIRVPKYIYMCVHKTHCRNRCSKSYYKCTTLRRHENQTVDDVVYIRGDGNGARRIARALIQPDKIIHTHILCAWRERDREIHKECVGDWVRVGANEMFSTVSRVVGTHIHIICVSNNCSRSSHFDSFRVIIIYITAADGCDRSDRVFTMIIIIVYKCVSTGQIHSLPSVYHLRLPPQS